MAHKKNRVLKLRMYYIHSLTKEIPDAFLFGHSKVLGGPVDQVELVEAVEDEGVRRQGCRTELNQLHIPVVHLAPDSLMELRFHIQRLKASPAAGVVIEKYLVGEAVSIPPPHASVHL